MKLEDISTSHGDAEFIRLRDEVRALRVQKDAMELELRAAHKWISSLFSAIQAEDDLEFSPTDGEISVYTPTTPIT